MVEHVDAQDPEIHEPKGVSSASSGEVYVADGLGSGSWASPFFSGSLVRNNASAVAVASVGTTAQQLTIFNSEDLLSYGVSASAGDTLTINTDGVYLIIFNACFETNDSGDAGIYQFRLRLNGSEPSFPANLGAVKELTGTSDLGSVGFSGLVPLQDGDVLSIWVESDEGGDTDQIDFYEAQFSAVFLGEV